MLSEITRVSVPPNKAVVGANAFAHEAGIHQDGILKNPLTYQVISPDAVGVPAHRLVLGKHSGRNAVRSRLADLGVTLAEDEIGRCYRLVMALADVKKDINDADMLRLAREAQSGRECWRMVQPRHAVRGKRHEPKDMEHRRSPGRWHRPGSGARRDCRSAGLRPRIWISALT